VAGKLEGISMDTEFNGILERLAQFERDLEQMRDGLALLGAKRCAECKKFFRSSDTAVLFDSGPEQVCYPCLPIWWKQRSGELELKEREAIEHKLVRWLINYHGAELIQRARRLPEEQQQEFRLAAECDQCEGTGTSLGARCRYCGGEGSMWVVIPKNPDV
jgi:hypothetical protein